MTSTPSTSGQAFPPDQLPSSSTCNPLDMATAAQHDAAPGPALGQAPDYSRWICIYPCYLNKAFSISDARKVPTSLALDGPVLSPHIFEVVANKLGMRAVLQRKRHPKDWDVYGVGRVRVSLTDEKGAYVNDEIRTRKDLFRAVAELMKKHPMAVPRAPGAIVSGAQQPGQQKSGQQKPGGLKGGLPRRK